MVKNTNDTPPQSAWRAFERLVARIETELAPKGAVVRSPDRVPDLVTGKKREVDATIRVNVGSADILITVECRRRSRTSDVRWIEELATKRTAIGAAKTIAVSAKGFSDEARRAATRYGIELRLLEESAGALGHDWVTTSEFLHAYRILDSFVCDVVLVGGESVAVDAMENVFRHPLVQHEFPAVAFATFEEIKNPGVVWKLPIDGSSEACEIRLAGDDPLLIPVPLGEERRPGILEMQFNGEFLAVQEMRLSMRGRLVVNAATPSNGPAFNYGTPEGPIAALSEYTAEFEGKPMRLQAVHMPDGSCSLTSVFPDGFEVPSDARKPILTDMSVVDTSMLHMLPVAIKVIEGERAEGVFVKPSQAFFEHEVDLEAFDKENFLFVDREGLERIRAGKDDRSTINMGDYLYVVPRNVVEWIDLAPAIAEIVARDRRKSAEAPSLR